MRRQYLGQREGEFGDEGLTRRDGRIMGKERTKKCESGMYVYEEEHHV